MNTLMNHEAMLAAAMLLTKITLLPAVAWCVHVLLRKTNPRWRVLLWRSTGVGMLLLIGLAVEGGA